MIDIAKFAAQVAASPNGAIALGKQAVDDIVADLRAGQEARREAARLRKLLGRLGGVTA